jgi:flavin reductase (DIM6/NTAB) family NADH-FMN oxidoreductase RutF
MFYDVEKRPTDILPHDPFKAIVAPRPIGWISTIDGQGRANLAPYSFFNAISSRPPLVMFSSEGMKDTVSNIVETAEFVCSLATWELRDAMNRTSAPLPHNVSEFEHAGLKPAPSQMVRPPRVAQSPVALECRAIETKALVDLGGRETGAIMVIGQVIAVYIDDSMIVDGRFDLARAKPIARCGYADYTVVDSLFSLSRPNG